MEILEKWGYIFLSIVAVIYLIAMIAGMIAAFPIGILGFVLLIGVGLLFIKVVKERAANKEDDYYSKKVDK